ncbi:MAG: RibD family protein, partial [Alphaproteobacteria bacterium]|nr:RibD family protein [Alphaproteobacteria bacterium]
RGRPLVALKLATTLDGRIATRSGESRWISGEPARAAVHALRAEYDAVLIGAGTAVADDPDLGCRLPGLDEDSPVRVVADRRLRTPLTHKLVREAERRPSWFLVGADAEADRRRAFAEAGVEPIETALDAAGQIDLADALGHLARRGVTRLLCEGGAQIAAALLRADLVDRLYLFQAGTVLGGDGHAAVAPFGISRLASAPRFVPVAFRSAGLDRVEVWRRDR